MHRFDWDMHYDPLPGGGGGGRGGGGGANGAVPHRTYPGVASPWVAPGSYVVRLTVNGQSQTQPITIKLDPRIKITPDVARIFTLTTQMEDGARSAVAAYKEAREMLAKAQAAHNDALVKQLEALAPEVVAPAGGGGRGGGGGGGGFGGPPEPPTPANLSNIAGRMVTAALAMQASEMPPTDAEVKACNDQQAAYTALMAKWSALKAKK
jgi:hypothetical protein